MTTREQLHAAFTAALTRAAVDHHRRATRPALILAATSLGALTIALVLTLATR